MAIFNKEFIENYNTNILNEGKVDDLYESSRSAIILFYQHMCKWLEKKELQSVSWINTIINNSRKSISSLYDRKLKQTNTNALNLIKNNLRSIYSDAMSESRFLNNNSDIAGSMKAYQLFNTIEKISNEAPVRKVMIENAKDNEIIESINNKS